MDHVISRGWTGVPAHWIVTVPLATWLLLIHSHVALVEVAEYVAEARVSVPTPGIVIEVQPELGGVELPDSRKIV
jgi:hypothetical protein